jgi:beta-N-acetylhexosaminidase
MSCAKPRRQQVPEAIAAGCDMFLYFNDPDEDFGFMLDGYKSGVITPERLDDALRRILGFKASLKLHEKQAAGALVPPAGGLTAVGCEKHQEIALQAAQKSITLVKDTRHNLPITPKTHPRIKLYYICQPPMSLREWPDPVRAVIVEELQRAGFQVDVDQTFYDMEKVESQPGNMWKANYVGSMADFRAKYDAVMMWSDVRGYAQENIVRIKWPTGHSAMVPWYTAEIPSIFISLSYTTHLIDVPMFKTFINAYADTRATIRETIRKITGEASFQGQANDTVFCGKWDTRR